MRIVLIDYYFFNITIIGNRSIYLALELVALQTGDTNCALRGGCTGHSETQQGW